MHSKLFDPISGIFFSMAVPDSGVTIGMRKSGDQTGGPCGVTVQTF